MIHRKELRLLRKSLDEVNASALPIEQKAPLQEKLVSRIAILEQSQINSADSTFLSEKEAFALMGQFAAVVGQTLRDYVVEKPVTTETVEEYLKALREAMTDEIRR